MRPRSLAVLVAAALLAAACGRDGADRDRTGKVANAGKVSVFDLQVGDCLLPGDELGGEIADIEAVPCAQPHTHEVFALPDFKEGGDVYPGEDKLKAFANAQCLEAFGEYTGADYLESKHVFSYLQPSVKSWQNGKDRRIVCVIVATGKPVEGSARATGRKRRATSTTAADGSTTTTVVGSTTP